MLEVFKSPQIPDQDKPDNGTVLFGLQEGKSISPLPFYVTGNNSAIVSFTAVEFDQFKIEVGRITLDTSIIDIDLTNNIYNVDGLTGYDVILENGIYRFEFQNNENLWASEYFKVTDKSDVWILDSGFWVDANKWIDEEFWID